MKRIVYPNLHIRYSNNQMNISTHVRKKHTDEKWYLIPYRKTVSLEYGLHAGRIADLIRITHADIYMISMFSIIVPGGGSPLYHELDEDQREEAERLK